MPRRQASRLATTLAPTGDLRNDPSRAPHLGVPPPTEVQFPRRSRCLTSARASCAAAPKPLCIRHGQPQVASRTAPCHRIDSLRSGRPRATLPARWRDSGGAPDRPSNIGPHTRRRPGSVGRGTRRASPRLGRGCRARWTASQRSARSPRSVSRGTSVSEERPLSRDADTAGVPGGAQALRREHGVPGHRTLKVKPQGREPSGGPSHLRTDLGRLGHHQTTTSRQERCTALRGRPRSSKCASHHHGIVAPERRIVPDHLSALTKHRDPVQQANAGRSRPQEGSPASGALDQGERNVGQHTRKHQAGYPGTRPQIGNSGEACCIGESSKANGHQKAQCMTHVRRQRPCTDQALSLAI